MYTTTAVPAASVAVEVRRERVWVAAWFAVAKYINTCGGTHPFQRCGGRHPLVWWYTPPSVVVKYPCCGGDHPLERWKE